MGKCNSKGLLNGIPFANCVQPNIIYNYVIVSKVCVKNLHLPVLQLLIGDVCQIIFSRWIMKKLKRRQASKYAAVRPQWELDYDLQAQDDLSLFWQYLEIGMSAISCLLAVAGS